MEKDMDLYKNKRQSFGVMGETAAADYLLKHNYKILKRNFRIGRIGEIDIIARENEYICFIEVKTRTGLLFGLPCESVTARKQERIKKLAHLFLCYNNLSNRDIRFDVVEVFVEGKEDRLAVKKINIIKNAF